MLIQQSRASFSGTRLMTVCSFSELQLAVFAIYVIILEFSSSQNVNMPYFMWSQSQLKHFFSIFASEDWTAGVDSNWIEKGRFSFLHCMWRKVLRTLNWDSMYEFVKIETLFFVILYIFHIFDFTLWSVFDVKVRTSQNINTSFVSH